MARSASTLGCRWWPVRVKPVGRSLCGHLRLGDNGESKKREINAKPIQFENRDWGQLLYGEFGVETPCLLGASTPVPFLAIGQDRNGFERNTG